MVTIPPRPQSVGCWINGTDAAQSNQEISTTVRAAKRATGTPSRSIPLTLPNERVNMKPMRWFSLALCTVGMLVFSSGTSATPFTITNAQFLPGSGYGIESNESQGTLLDVRFLTSGFVTQNFALNAVGQSFTFNFGTIDLEEPNSQGAISPDELDNLGISARLIFTAPTGVVQTVTATGVAFPGSVSDASVDFVIDWSPIEVLFGNGGKFRLSLTDMALNDMGSQFQTATVTLLSLSDGNGSTPVPEPTSMALVGMAIGCLAITRRRQVNAKET